ncbi:MAG: hypothetical protein P8J32_07470 [bacterium]|nr:hypothetical protein [bacterium]
MRFKKDPLELIKGIREISNGTTSQFSSGTRCVRHYQLGTPVFANVELETFRDAEIPFTDYLVKYIAVMPARTIDRIQKIFEIK